MNIFDTIFRRFVLHPTSSFIGLIFRTQVWQTPNPNLSGALPANHTSSGRDRIAAYTEIALQQVARLFTWNPINNRLYSRGSALFQVTKSQNQRCGRKAYTTSTTIKNGSHRPFSFDH